MNPANQETELTELDHIPDGLLEREATALYNDLPGPTLIHLRGRIERPLVVGVLAASCGDAADTTADDVAVQEGPDATADGVADVDPPPSTTEPAKTTTSTTVTPTTTATPATTTSSASALRSSTTA